MDLLRALAPETVLTVWGLILLLLAGSRHGTAEDQRLAGQLTLVALASGLLATWWSWTQLDSTATVSHMLAHQEPSLNQSRLSARLVPVGSEVPLNDWSS